jgi:hypothetical protein
MDRRTDRDVNNGRSDRKKDEWTDRQMDGRTDGQINRPRDQCGLMDRQMDERTDQQTDGQMKIQRHDCIKIDG